MRALRELTRYRQTLTYERTQDVNRLHKLLESANLKLGAVATDILGKSGRDMLEAILTGEQGPETLAELARGRLRAKFPLLRQALEGRGQALHRVLIRLVLAPFDFLERQLAHLARDIEEVLAPCAEAVALLETIPCVGHTAAVATVAEIGTDMSRFPSAGAAQAPGFVGWRVPWEPPERRQAAGRQDYLRRHLVVCHPGRSGLVHRSHLQ